MSQPLNSLGLLYILKLHQLRSCLQVALLGPDDRLFSGTTPRGHSWSSIHPACVWNLCTVACPLTIQSAALERGALKECGLAIGFHPQPSTIEEWFKLETWGYFWYVYAKKSLLYSAPSSFGIVWWGIFLGFSTIVKVCITVDLLLDVQVLVRFSEITKVHNSLSGMFAMNFGAHGRAMVFQLEHGFRV